MTTKRCAIYARKSTDEGLEQAFNSLDAQREACAAYILSQAHEGWEQIHEHYDDGGWSGGNMDRPGLKQLLADVARDKVDVIVVYKVDRLTRSLADFARIVDTLDKAGASFVSVTQAFNTTNSMGRLTLNVLLSFAQFEREVTSERIRDKIAASKKKGIWMGGPVPLGYRLGNRKLLMDDDEAEIVRSIFRRYSELRSVTKLAEELAQQNVRTKVRQYSNGRIAGGVHFQRGSLSQLLQNPIYAGKVPYRAELYDGEHDGIIAERDWAEVQQILASNRHDRKLGKQTRYPSLLTGMISDPEGRPMTPVSTHKGSRRHRYYVTRLRPGEDKQHAWRVPANELDSAAMAAVCDWLRSHERPCQPGKLMSDRELADELPDFSIPTQRKVLIERGVKVQLGEMELCLSIADEAQTVIRLPVRTVRRGTELKVVLESGDRQRAPDPVLLKLVALAMSARKSLFSSKTDQMTSHYSKRHLWQLLRISFLAPDIVTAIVEGRQPPSLTGRRLLRVTDLPLDWPGQRRILGFS
ncbi:recombinase family protein [Sphingomonas rhizophila]|uniref:Recombinase family protein n=1 Tax=Sphingomonas rhizophila TaxID=2071607 RepID=A0A7G9S9U6_9SPHN|nr:recombinase family protein [Sphingomonas rhizophila]QNN64621.1 recombinase family protein [Sphingomonas rhizophila]